MIAFARVVYLALLPSVLCGAVLAIAWRRVGAGPWRTTLQVLATLFLLAPQPFVLFLGSYSSALRPYQQLLFALLGFGMAVLCALSWRAYPPRQRWHSIRLALAGVLMAGVGAYFGAAVVGDYLLSHVRTIGRVQGTWVVRHGRAPDTYRVLIDGKSYGITVDLLSRIHEGDVVEADVGAATSTIVRIRRDVPGAASPGR